MDWWHWHTEPELIGGLLLVIWLYAVFTGPLRYKIAPAVPYPLGSALCFYPGMILLYLTVGSPLDFVGEVYLFSAHMAQHILLMYPVSILLILGMPDWLTRPVLRISPIKRVMRFLTHPVVAGLAFAVTINAWHLPLFYESALRIRWVHNLEHATMFGSSFLMWWVVFSRSKEVPPIPYGAQIIFIFLVSLTKIPVAAYLTFSSEVLYPTYEFAPRIIGLSAIEDQVTGGAMKTLTGKFVGVLIMSYSFYHWYKSHVKEEEEAQDTATTSPQRQSG